MLMTKSSLDQCILQAIQANPGITTAMLATDFYRPESTIRSALYRLITAGKVHTHKGKNPQTGKHCRKNSLLFFLVPEEDSPTSTHKPDEQAMTVAVATNQVVALEKRIQELLAWKANAIARYPALGTDPKLLKARELLAAKYGDSPSAAWILEGK